jgi:hypothetical protein
MNYLNTIGLYLEIGQLTFSLSLLFQQLSPRTNREIIAVVKVLGYKMLLRLPYQHY